MPKSPKESSKLSSQLSTKNLWARNGNPIWLASTVSLFRNLERFKFPAAAPSDARKQIVSLIGSELLNSKQLTKPLIIKAEECTPIDKEFLFEHFLTLQSFYQAHSGEAFVVDDTGEFAAIINMPDHLELVLSDQAGELEKALSRLIKIDVDLGKTLQFAFSPRFGFLTSQPAHCGTGLVVQAFLQLPALIHRNQISSLIAKYRVEGINVSGLHGSPQEHIGDLIVINNSYCLGVTEDQIISMIRTFATQLMIEEKRVRLQIQKQNDGEIRDKVSRSFGLLTFGYQLEASETLNALSLVKLGVDLGWVQNVSIEKLNELFFNSRRAHLIAVDFKDVRPEELAHKRAEFLHSALREARLTV